MKAPSPPDLTTALAELENRVKAEENFYEFFKRAWHVIEPGYEYVDNWHIGAIAEHLEAITNGQIRFLIINCPPRLLKTNLVSVAWPAWEWIRTPAQKWLYASYSWTLAEDASIKCRQLLRSEWYRARWGDRFALSDDRDKKDHFSNDRGGERIITSPDSTTTGRGASRLCLDDINSTRDQSDVVLDSTLQFLRQVLPTRMNDPRTSSIVNVQQRTHERDATGYYKSNERDGWVHLCLPNEFEVKRRCVTVVLPSTAPKKWVDPRVTEGELLFPKRLDQKETGRLRRSLGEYAAAGQLQQRPAPAEGGIIKTKWFLPWKEPKRPECKWIVNSWDTALSEKKKAAYSACHTYGVFKNAKGMFDLILLARYRARVEYPELRKVAQMIALDYMNDDLLRPIPLDKQNRKNKADLILIEDKTSGKSLISDLARINVRAYPFNPDRYGDKLQRVRLVTPHLEAGVVHVPYRGPSFERPFQWVEQFLLSCATFPNAEARDDVDVLTQVLIYLIRSGWVLHPDDEDAKPKKKYADDVRKEAFY